MATTDDNVHPAALSGRKILIVDDERLNIKILSQILTREGFAVADADSGEKALEVYAETRPDLVLMDVVLPGINGFETCRQLRARYGTAAGPVIFITAKNASDDVVEGLEAGGVDYLVKPIRQKEALARIRTHLQIVGLMDEQRRLVDQLSQANAAKSRFLGMAAHDLRNPLASIRGLAEFLGDGTLGSVSAEQLDAIETIRSSSQHMLLMVNDLLDISTIEAGELRIAPDTVVLSELVDKSTRLNNIEAAKKKTRIVHTARSPGARINADPSRIRQVADNLLSNAVKYSPAGSLVEVETAVDGATASFSVSDQGPGIPEKERHRLFRDFGTLSNKPTGGEKSTGLGLAICRKIIEAHRGTITAENRPGGGSVFRVAIPL